MNLTLIAAIAENNVIGIEDKIPWRIKEDMERFKQLTINHPVIMGRKTYESIPEKFRPLPERKNIVLSRTLKPTDGIYIAHSINDAIKIAECNDSYVMGGEQVYKSFMPWIDKMEITKVHANYNGDAFFPEINWKEWKLVNEEKKINDKGLEFSFLTYDRITTDQHF